jgi:hypothetical protein
MLKAKRWRVKPSAFTGIEACCRTMPEMNDRAITRVQPLAIGQKLSACGGELHVTTALFNSRAVFSGDRHNPTSGH